MKTPITDRDLPEEVMAAMMRLEEEAYRAGQHGCCEEGSAQMANPSVFKACDKHGPRCRALREDEGRAPAWREQGGRVRPANVIARWPPQDGNEWECQCARCGSSMARIECQSCGGEGVTGPGELYDLDPLWYDRDDEAPCFTCHGEAAWMVCVSQNYGEEEDSPGGDWCEANPMPGREAQKSAPEWFVTRLAAAGDAG